MIAPPPHLLPTAPHHRAEEYAAPGGAWDRPSLDRLLTTADAPGTLVVDDRGARLDADDQRAEVARLAGALAALGVGASDVVAWQLTNRHEAALLYRACWRLGAVAAPIHHQAGAADVERMLEALRPRAVVAEPGTPTAALHDALDVDGAWRRTGDPNSEPNDDAAGLAAVLFTSGSSGTPKAVLHDRRALAYKAAVMVDTHGLTADDAVLMPAPLAHVSGLLNGVLVPGAVPCKSVLMARWDPERALEIIEREQITFMVGPPTFFVALMAAPGFAPARVASLRLISSGGAGVTETFCERASETLGARVKRTYGSTEAPTVATSRPDDSVAVERRHDGRSIGSVELRVVDPSTGVPASSGERGELWVRGPELCVGYVDRDQTAASFRADGWFRTGDLATLEAGWLTIVGRLSDVIIRGGENVSATEIEAVLEAHADVRHAVAVGYPDELMGERVCAFVVTVPGSTFDLERCREWFADQGVARFKTPEQVVEVATLPLLATGKPDREALRANASSRFGS